MKLTRLKDLNKHQKILICSITAAAVGIVCCIGILLYLHKPSAAAEADATEEPTATPSSTPSPTPDTSAEKVSADLKNLIDNYLTTNGIDTSQVGIYITDLTSTGTYTLNPDQYFIAASTYKLPLAMYYYEKINSGEISKDQVLSYSMTVDGDSQNADIASTLDGSSPDPTQPTPPAATPVTDPTPVTTPDQPAPAADTPAPTPEATAAPEPQVVVYNATIEEALHSMVLYSDNTAAEALFTNLGGWQAFKQDILPYSDSVTDANSDRYYSYDNVFTPTFMNDVLYYLYTHKDAFPTLLSDMLASQPDDYLNKNIGDLMDQKYGDYGGALNAIGLSSTGKPYTIAVYTYGFENGTQIIGDINELCYKYFNQQ